MSDPEILGPNDEVSMTAIGNVGMDAITRSEINMQVQFAQEHPRSIEKVRKELESLVTMSQSIAEETFYTLKRKDKDGTTKLIQGPSIRFAEVLCYCWGNARWLKAISNIDNEFVTGKGVFMDLQRNVAGQVETKRRITDKNGKRYGADMIQVTGNASSSLAYRNAVTGTIPQALWKDILEKAKITAIGGAQSISDKRNKAIEYGEKLGVTAEQIYATLGVQGLNDLGIDELISLRGLFNSVKDGESSIEDAFGDPFEKEITALMDQLQWPKPKREMVLREYKGKSSDLLAYLTKQAEPLNVGQAKQEKQAEPTPETKAEPATQQEAVKDEPARRGRPRKDTAEPAKEPEPKPEPVVQAETKPEVKPEPAKTAQESVSDDLFSKF